MAPHDFVGGDEKGDHVRVIRIGIDTGGTFTDVVAVDTETGHFATTKTPSTPADPADGFLAGIDKILDLIGAAPADVESILHGTTVATNQLLQGKVGAPRLHHHQGLRVACWRLPGSRSRTATAIPTSG